MKKIIKRFWWVALIVVFLILIVPIPIQSRLGHWYYNAITYQVVDYSWWAVPDEDRPNGLESGYKVVILGFTVYDDAVERTAET